MSLLLPDMLDLLRRESNGIGKRGRKLGCLSSFGQRAATATCDLDRGYALVVIPIAGAFPGITC